VNVLIPPQLPTIPAPSALWRPVRTWIWAAYAVLILAAVPDLVVQYWFNSSLGFRTIFWTNLTMQLLLGITFGALVFAGITVPMRLYARSTALKQAAFHVALWLAIFAGWRAADRYDAFLLAVYGVPFGKVDPVFGHDIGFYVYALPVIGVTLRGLLWILLLSTLATLVARYDAIRRKGLLEQRDLEASAKIGLLCPTWMRWLWDAEGFVLAALLFTLRYSLLFKDNEEAGVRVGAQYLDVVGVFSTVNYIYVSIAVELALCFVLSVWMRRMHAQHGWRLDGGAAHDRASHSVDGLKLAQVGGVVLAVDFVFFAAVVINDHVFVKPNEPWIQKPFIERHLDATVSGYRLEQVKAVEWRLPKTPLSPQELVTSKTLQNAPFLPSWVAHLEQPPDVQHLERLNLSDSTLVYGPMLQIFNQQQALRPYYSFTNVDGVRYTVNGEKKMFVSAVRELPSLAFLGPKEWLRYWGSAALMFTHGFGLVMSPANDIDEVGSPRYASANIPPTVTDAAFEHEPRIYFGEGAKDDYVLTNIRGLKEFDHVTDQAWLDVAMPRDVPSGIEVNSLWRRIMFALHTKDLTAFLFSDYIDENQTRVHIRRTPMLRAQAIAPFLFLDSNNHAFIANKRVHWMVNALTTTDQYPYAFREVLGDKADERAVYPFPERTMNYGEDSVKIVMDAYSGQITFFKMNDDPIVSTWAKVYPDLFRPASDMAADVKAQLTYPLQWFHIQFDDIYKRYHQKDPIQFYNVEDLWDDADEVLGSLGRGLKGFGSTDQSTFSYEGHPMLIDPADLPPGVDIGTPGQLEYAMVWPFTPEGQRNLRSVIVVFQDPENYGKVVSLRIPQGEFVPGPEQIESYIDNDRPVHQKLTMWIRHASEVIRGHLMVLPVKGDLMYVETIWVNSTQNEMPQLKLFALRYHGRISSGATLTDALQKQWSIADGPGERLASLSGRQQSPMFAGRSGAAPTAPVVAVPHAARDERAGRAAVRNEQ
jgi:uncharacterized membrane protein (UPF0182 family)